MDSMQNVVDGLSRLGAAFNHAAASAKLLDATWRKHARMERLRAQLKRKGR